MYIVDEFANGNGVRGRKGSNSGGGPNKRSDEEKKQPEMSKDEADVIVQDIEGISNLCKKVNKWRNILTIAITILN